MPQSKLRSLLLRSTAGRLPGIRPLLAEHDRLSADATALRAELAALRTELEDARRARSDEGNLARRRQLDAESGAWRRARWLGSPVRACPLDLWAYQELVEELDPDLIVETGTAFGGIAHFLADLCELRGNGEVVGIDEDELPGRPRHRRLRFMQGAPASTGVLAALRTLAQGKSCVLAILDADRSRSGGLEELRQYAPLVTPGSYLIVRGSSLNERAGGDSGPPGAGLEGAVERFLCERADFERDAAPALRATSNPRGFLRRRAP